MKNLLVYFVVCGLIAAPVINAQETRTEQEIFSARSRFRLTLTTVCKQPARLENFKLSGVLIDHYPGFVEAWAIVKLAAAHANTDVGAMKPERLAAIEKADCRNRRVSITISSSSIGTRAAPALRRT